MVAPMRRIVCASRAPSSIPNATGETLRVGGVARRNVSLRIAVCVSMAIPPMGSRAIGNHLATSENSDNTPKGYPGGQSVLSQRIADRRSAGRRECERYPLLEGIFHLL